MELTLLCNTGVCLEYEGHCVLVDALNGSIHAFAEIDTRLAQQIVDGVGKYAKVDALLYTHLHPDHYSQPKNADFLKNHRAMTTFFPMPDTPDGGLLQAGAFTVEYFYVEHMPCDYTWAKHYALLVSAGGACAYFTADTEVNPARHMENLAGRVADYAFWNPLYLSYPETRELIRSVAKQSYIYHVPDADRDQTGIYRKLEQNIIRYGRELPNMTVLRDYPMALK